MYRHGDREIPAVYVQLLVGRKRKRQILSLGIFDLAQNNIGRQIHLQGGGNQEFRLGCVGIDVKAGRDAEIQVHHGLGRALSRDQRNRSHRNRRRFARLRELSLPAGRAGQVKLELCLGEIIPEAPIVKRERRGATSLLSWTGSRTVLDGLPGSLRPACSALS